MDNGNANQFHKKKFPVRLHGPNSLVAIRLPDAIGASARIYLRDVAKEISLYYLPIEAGISGVDTLGKWLFGTPGYMGHIRVFNWDGSNCKVEYPRNSPPEVAELISEIKKCVESK